MTDNPKVCTRQCETDLPQGDPTIVGFWQDQNHSLSLTSFRSISKDFVEILIVAHPASRTTRL